MSPTHIKPQIPNSVDTLRVALPPNSTSPTSVGPERLAPLVRQSGTLPYPLPTHRRSEEHTSELQSRLHLVCRLLLEKKKKKIQINQPRAPDPVRVRTTPRESAE